MNHGINLKRMRNVVDCWRASTSHAESRNSLEAHPTAFMEMWSIMTIFCGESSNFSFEITKLKWKLRAKCSLWWIRPKTSLFISKSSWSSRWINSQLGQWHVSNPKVAADCVLRPRLGDLSLPSGDLTIAIAILWMIYLYHTQVGGRPTPLKNDGVRLLGWWHSQ